MRQNDRETAKQIALSLLFALIIISYFSTTAFAQAIESDEPSDIVVSEHIMEQVVRRVLVWSFKSRNKPTVIYLAEQRIKESWLPKIKNIEFRLLSNEEIQEKSLKVHFFTKLERLENSYDIGFAFGDPSCEFLGMYWHFRISKQKVRLWQNGGVGGFCNS